MVVPRVVEKRRVLLEEIGALFVDWIQAGSFHSSYSSTGDTRAIYFDAPALGRKFSSTQTSSLGAVVVVYAS